MLLVLFITLGVVAAVPTMHSANDSDRFALPDDLLIGAGVSAAQTEGAWNKSGKGESAINFALHNGDLTPMGYYHPHEDEEEADSYHRFREDIEAAAKLKLQVYRMSISWARVLPEVDPSKPNAEGVAFYHSYIDEILKYNMTPLVTMYHFDHPQSLETDINGWMDRRIVPKFRDYAAFLLKEYGQKVSLWTTVNEPNIYCSIVQNMIELGRGKTYDSLKDLDIYPCLHNFLLAHGEVNKIFREGNYAGKLGFTVTTLLSVPLSTSSADVYASEAYNQMFAGMLLHPLVYGDYPQMVKDISRDKLLKFTDAEKEMLRNSTDYIGLNVYYGMVVEYKDPATPRRNVKVPMSQLFKEANFINVGYRSPTGESLDDFPFEMIAPDAMRNALQWTWLTYKVPIMITENGIGYAAMPGVHDHQRAVYHSAFMRAMVSSIRDYGVKVIGYCAWSLIESWEWTNGYTRDFGLVHVDYEHGSLNRTLKDSASFWWGLAERRVVPLVESSSASSLPRLSPLLILLMVLAGLGNNMLWATTPPSFHHRVRPERESTRDIDVHRITDYCDHC